ncbi:hypothetical protein [Pseudomaricurvus sp.]|uniref:hypothetical protein n=1 Tax=Pseudomaricurvus sp. TaxID=2004510 RepID=UPI003F6BCC02
MMNLRLTGRGMRLSLWLFACVWLLAGCATSAPTDSEDAIDTVVINSAARSTRESAQALKDLPALPSGKLTAPAGSSVQLDVGILIFESQDVTGNTRLQEQGVFPLVRKAESRYLPYLLRQTMAASGQWGVVRVMPDTHASAELVVTGDIQISNGEQLQIHIQAHDSSERLWLNKVYRQNVGAQAYEDPQLDPFQSLFDRLSLDLIEARNRLTASQLEELRQLAVLRYGQQLAPDAFGQYVQQNELGQLQIQRLPAHGDPMLRRVQKLREYEYYFIDTVDDQYSNLFVQMQQTYQRWRQYSRELMVYMRDYKQRQAGQSSGFRRGSLASMNEVYGDYEWYRMQELNLSELASGFNNEVLPTVLNLDDNVVQLDGNLQDQYQKWQNILQEIFNLEQGQI